MKKNVDKVRAHDISNVSGTYAKALSERMQDIYAKYRDPSVSADDLKRFVVECVSSAKDTAGKAEFVRQMMSHRTKDEIVMHATNSLMRGSNMSSRLDDMFSSGRR